MTRSVDGEVTLTTASAELAVQRGALIELWVAVTEGGGAVGFRPPVAAADVAPVVEGLLVELAQGVSRAITARDGDGRVVGLIVAVPGAAPRFAHRVTLRRLLVHPERQGRGLGARLLSAAHRMAVQEFGAELALVEVRDGLGLEAFYGRQGYREVGRIPGGLAFGDGDRVDELFLVRELP